LGIGYDCEGSYFFLVVTPDNYNTRNVQVVVGVKGGKHSGKG